MPIKVGNDQEVAHTLLRPLQQQGIIELRLVNELEQTWDRCVTQQTEARMLDAHSRLHGRDAPTDEKATEVEATLGPGNRKNVATSTQLIWTGWCEHFVTENRADLIDGGKRKRARIPARLEDPSVRGTHPRTHSAGVSGRE